MISQFLEAIFLNSFAEPVDPRFLACAHVLADKAASVTLPFFRKILTVDNKLLNGDFDPVTAADHAAEKIISDHLAGVFPDHGLEGEEFGYHREGRRFKWVVDPIDGTRSFIIGSPMWGTLIGLMDRTQPLLGLIDQPFTKERFWSDGMRTFFSQDKSNQKIICTRKCENLDEAILMTTDPELFKEETKRSCFYALRSRVRMTRYSGDCYAYALLASGLVDVILECELKPHDIIPLIPIVQSAGGCLTDWKGNVPVNGGSVLACGDKKLHEKIIKLLQ